MTQGMQLALQLPLWGVRLIESRGWVGAFNCRHSRLLIAVAK